MSLIKQLTSNIVERNLLKETAGLVEKWEKTGLLDGLPTELQRSNMARLLENQAAQLLKEASAMSNGDVEGFASVAFPIVRRVFGELIAEELVSVQPMSLPSGLLFFLDFTYTDAKISAGAVAGQSIFGGGVVASQLTGGINLDAIDVANDLWNSEKSLYSLNNAYSAPTGSASVALTRMALRSGSGIWTHKWNGIAAGDVNYANLGDRLIQYDPDLSGSVIGVYKASKSAFTNLSTDNLVSLRFPLSGTMAAFAPVRRLTRHDPLSGSGQLLFVVATSPSGSEDTNTLVGAAGDAGGETFTITYAVSDAFTTGLGIGSVVGTTPWGLEGTAELAGNSGTNADIPEIDIKVDSVAVTAQSRKLKAKWTPELAQDLNAYHSLNAESELTSILSEQIALEIDREILVDLIHGAKGLIRYWSRKPGKFVHKSTGADITNNGAWLPDFTGTVQDWYQTLMETINDVSAAIHRKVLRGGANFIVTSPEICSILDFTTAFRADIAPDEAKGQAGPTKVGTLSKRWDVYNDPYFPRNVILVGRKGSSFLESGYVYGPYIPLQTSPTVLGVEDFVSRKMVSSRYSKKLVRSDMYGLVVVQDLVG